MQIHSKTARPSYTKPIQAYENIEHFIGLVKVPVSVSWSFGVGLFATGGDYLVPLATTEAALVASYNRGSKLITACGGANAMLLNEGVTRTPGFAFQRDQLKPDSLWLGL